MQITAGLVKELREISGAGMMDCKKALSECNGNIDEAMEYLRKNGQAKAEKKTQFTVNVPDFVLKHNSGLILLIFPGFLIVY